MGEGLGLIDRAQAWSDRIAIGDDAGTYTYSDLLVRTERGASCLLGGEQDLREARIAFMVEPSYGYVVTQWSVWRAGAIAVPLCLTHPAPELEHVLDTTRPSLVVTSEGYLDVIGPLARTRSIDVLLLDDMDAKPVALPVMDPGGRAMMLFTSGTTGKPKGVVSTHANIEAQIRSLTEAWEWVPDDRILLSLPLHHIHGIVNVVGCALWNGARCDMLARFDAGRVIDALMSGDLTLYMAVPTIYHRLIAALEEAPEDKRRAFKDRVAGLRLMVSGSAALPVPVLDRWKELSGHVLLERYGMTEIGMGLSNPYRGERTPGTVGTPLPGVEVRLVDEAADVVGETEPGEIQVRGPTVFREYWERPEDTEAAFTEDGWFRTGDTAVIENGRYRILGRSSVDILKTGAEKVSALEIEDALLGHEAISEAAVVGIDDAEWGQRVVAVLVADKTVEASALRGWLRESLAPQKIPKEFYFVDALPRNALGKTMKPEVVRYVMERAQAT